MRRHTGLQGMWSFNESPNRCYDSVLRIKPAAVAGLLLTLLSLFCTAELLRWLWPTARCGRCARRCCCSSCRAVETESSRSVAEGARLAVDETVTLMTLSLHHY